VYPKVSRLAAWSKSCKWYSSLPLYAVVSLFMSQSSELCFSTIVFLVVVVVVVVVYFIIDSVW